MRGIQFPGQERAVAKVNVAPIIAANQKRWKAMRINPAKAGLIDAVARRLVAATAKSRYRYLEKQTGVPWPVIAVIHEREASQRWDRSIAQGDRWDRVSVHVPKGRGPFTSFIAAALDALQKCAPFAARWRNWTYGGALTLLIMYNGLGYDRRGLPSPYGWASTDQYRRGKYVADGVFDPNVVDPQLGCAAMLKRMAEIDPEAALKEESKKAETGGSVATGTATATETARQTAEQDHSWLHGMTVGRVLIIVGVSVAAAVAVYFVVKWVRQYRPVVVEHDDLRAVHAAMSGAERLEQEEHK
jgi:lysozyme family protein